MRYLRRSVRPPELRYVENTQIDADGYDACLRRDTTGLPYGRRWSLDAAHGADWSALVFGDYEAVMPLPFVRRFGQRWAMPMPFLQQLGAFGDRGIVRTHYPDFIEAIPKQFRSVHYGLNPRLKNKLLKTTRRTNYVLDLEQSWEAIIDNFSSSGKRKWRKVRRQPEWQIDKKASLAELIELHRHYVGPKLGWYRPATAKALESWLCAAIEAGCGQVWKLSIDGQTLAINFFAITEQRIVNLLPVTTEAGRPTQAQFYLLAERIRQGCSESTRTFDFEGSQVPGVARFYRQFGPQDEGYWALDQINLPYPLNCLYQRFLER